MRCQVSDLEKLYSTKEVADLFKVTPLTVRGWIQDNKLKAKKIGRAYYIKESAVAELANAEYGASE